MHKIISINEEMFALNISGQQSEVLLEGRGIIFMDTMVPWKNAARITVQWDDRHNLKDAFISRWSGRIPINFIDLSNIHPANIVSETEKKLERVVFSLERAHANAFKASLVTSIGLVCAIAIWPIWPLFIIGPMFALSMAVLSRSFGQMAYNLPKDLFHQVIMEYCRVHKYSFDDLDKFCATYLREGHITFQRTALRLSPLLFWVNEKNAKDR